jgi:hypothetical protein
MHVQRCEALVQVLKQHENGVSPKPALFQFLQSWDTFRLMNAHLVRLSIEATRLPELSAARVKPLKEVEVAYVPVHRIAQNLYTAVEWESANHY